MFNHNVKHITVKEARDIVSTYTTRAINEAADILGDSISICNEYGPVGCSRESHPLNPETFASYFTRCIEPFLRNYESYNLVVVVDNIINMRDHKRLLRTLFLPADFATLLQNKNWLNEVAEKIAVVRYLFAQEYGTNKDAFKL